VNEQFLVGPTPFSLDPETTYDRVEALLAAGVQVVVSLIAREELHLCPGMNEMLEPWLWEEAPRLKRQHMFLWRNGATPHAERVAGILNVIDVALAADERVFLHCIGARGRSGVAVGSWLARHGIAQGEAAIQALAVLRLRYGLTRPSPETRSQVRLVQCWQPNQ